MLEVQGLAAWYGDSHILHGVNLSVGKGERVALVGRNGAGKTTILRSIMNAGPRTTGRVAWHGSDLDKLAAFRRARLGMSLVPEDRRIYTHLTVTENVAMAAHLGGRKRNANAEAERIIDGFEMLVPLKKRLGGQLSGGQQQLLAIARAVMASPSLLLLDEPTEGLAPVIVERLSDDVVKACEESGAGLLLCEQNLWFARRCTSFVHVVDAGSVVYSGTWEEFEAREDIRTRYLAV